MLTQIRSPLSAPRSPRSKRRSVALSLLLLVAALGLPTPSAGVTAAKLQLSRVTGLGGTTIVVRGYNLPPSTRVQITWDGHFRGLPTAWVGSTGNFKISIKIPAGSAGDHKIGAYQVKSATRKVVTLTSQLGSRLAFARFVRTASTTPPPTTSGAAGAYGSIATDTKANILVGGPDSERVAHRFQASTSSALTSIRFAQRGGPGYSGGTGGTMRISVRADDGSGRPSGTSLASLTYSPGNASGGWWTWLNRGFPSPATLTKGQIYYIVFENIDPSPTTNYISVNELFVYGSALTPRQPTFSDATYAVLANGAVQDQYTADMDLTYANGVHDGMGYIEAMVALYGVVSGPNDMVREHFTVSGGARTVTSASVRVRRTNGSSPLTIRLETSAGALIEAVDIPASSIAVSAPGGDNGGAVWVTATFGSAHVLANGGTYNLRLSTASGTEYTTVPVREGTDVGFASSTFTDGDGQHTTDGSSW
ncbi:MAG: hypothetical protein ACHQNA_12970, partial [Acidimicrobiales bacterium]